MKRNLSVIGLAAVLTMATGCSLFTASQTDGTPPNEKEAWTTRPEFVFGVPLGAQIDADMRKAGIEAESDENFAVDIYYLPCSALRRPDYKFPKVGELIQRHGFFPCQVWVDRESRKIVQIVASPVAGATDQERDSRAGELCKLFEPAFGNFQKEKGKAAPFWIASFKDSKDQPCQAVLRCGKSDKDKLWSFHLLVYCIVKQNPGAQRAQQKEKKSSVAPFGLFNTCRDKVAILTAGDGVATGFVVRDGRKCWLYTNEHIARAGTAVSARTGAGKKLKLGAMQIASDRDLLRYELKGNPPAFELAKTVPDLQSEICVVGNSDGGGVLTELYGRVLGEGPDKIEIDAAFVKGNSGSPVFTRDQKVVGVATKVSKPVAHAESGWVNQNTRFAHVRRYALRTDNVRWVPVDRELYMRIVNGIDK